MLASVDLDVPDEDVPDVVEAEDDDYRHDLRVDVVDVDVLGECV